MNWRLLKHRPRRGALLTIMTSTLWLSACAFAPGGHIGYKAGGARINDVVDVRPITVELVQALASASHRQERVQEEPKASFLEVPTYYDYLIGRGDVLNIVVYDHPELTIPSGSERSAAESGNVVHSDGTIFYPYIGQVEVSGRTVRDVRGEIQRRLSSYIAKPQVDVSVAAFKAQKVYVTGQVDNPGTFPITNVPMRVLDALNFAKGFTQTANWHEVILTRHGQDFQLSIYDMLTHSDLTQNFLLRDGDVLHVPDVGNQQIYVMGEVNRPMSLGVGNSRLSLTNAVSRAGGIREGTANARGIFVVRRNPDTSKKFATVYQLNARNAAAFVLGSEFILQPSDVVYVTAAPIARWNRVLAQLLPSLTTLYQATEIGENVDNLRSND